LTVGGADPIIGTMSELEVADLITVEQAIAIVDAAVVRPRIIQCRLSESAGLRLAADVRNDRDAPPFDKSLMDGFAVRALDLASVPCDLEVVGRIAAGGPTPAGLVAGQTMAIMTGAPLPRGADAVVPIEMTATVAQPNRVRFLQTISPGRYMARRGSDMAADEVVLKAGTRLGAAQIAVAATVGAANLSVFAAPNVAVLGTGDELVGADQSPTTTQIRSCNNPMLLALLKNYPCATIDLGVTADEPEIIRRYIAEGLRHDVVIITGGMSLGERDFVPGILRELGGDLRITKLRIKPGKPFIFAVMPGGKFAFGLPGNPVSAFVCTLCFVSRLLERIAGGSPPRSIQSAPLAVGLETNGNRTFFQPALFDGQKIMPLNWKGSADVFTLSQANALLIRPENQPPQSAGTVIEFIQI
jgi:molybdopterin molybdotransferase